MAHSPHGVNFEAHRPVVMSRNGMVCAGHPLASQAGIAILQKGGNAVDAAIAMGAALNVVEPLMSGIGGDGYLMIYWKKDDRLSIVNATGAAPLAATRERYLSDGIPMKGILSVSVPALLAGWLSAHEKYGCLSLAEVFAPAIDLATNGFPTSHVLAKAIAADSLICEFPTSRAVFSRDGHPLQSGEILYQKDLGRTFQTIIDGGAEAFYRGEISRALVAFSKAQGGLLTAADLAQCGSRWEEPICASYRDYTVYEAPPNSSGHVLLQELNLVEHFDLKALGCNTAESIHAMVEAKKLAFMDREAFLGDPDFVDVPTEGLISRAYAQERVKLIDPDRAATIAAPGDPWRYQDGRKKSSKSSRPSTPGESKGDTTCFVVVDCWGNAVCQLQSLQSPFGSSLIAGNTGILLNNRMTYWHLEADHPDSLKPGKRVRHTMNPVMVFKSENGQRHLILICGTPGADTQVQTNLQVITHVLDFGMTVAEAVEAPRWRHTQNPTESTVPHTCNDELLLEGRFPEEVRRGLASRGHALHIIGDWEATGSEMMIQLDPQSGALFGAADPRRDGYAIGW
ncbi:MAG TPA: gamma-glutamyltransferase [Candidatus Binatia bacterium]|nr:gamma-glutamyltransferase [Candidatus Binatia bacterium]